MAFTLVRTSMDTLLEAIVDDDRTKVAKLLRADTKLATGLIVEAKLYESKIFHWMYVGDTGSALRQSRRMKRCT